MKMKIRMLPKSQRTEPTCKACLANIDYIRAVISEDGVSKKQAAEYGKAKRHTYEEGCWIRKV